MARKAPEVEGLLPVWTSPAFSHCVFTAAKDFDKTLGARFTKLMLAMDGKDEGTAEIFRLEAARRWVAGSPDGFETLIELLQAEKIKGTGGRSSLTPTGREASVTSLASSIGNPSMSVSASILERIGNTPMVRLDRVAMVER